MSIRMNTNLADVLRDAGCEVVEIDGWKTRTRHVGSHQPVGLLWHHTGPGVDGLAGARWMALVGRDDLPAPLCQLSLDPATLTWYVCAAGRANHAGEAKASGTVAAGDGNDLYIGVEVQMDGKGPYPEGLLEEMARGGAAIALHVLKTSVNTHRAHKETSVTGKWDIDHPMDNLRLRTQRHMLAQSVVKAPKPTRGARVDDALQKLRQARRVAKGERRVALKQAITALRGMPFVNLEDAA